jgi:uncharacterized protein YifN (PemK superfamily)
MYQHESGGAITKMQLQTLSQKGATSNQLSYRVHLLNIRDEPINKNQIYRSDKLHVMYHPIDQVNSQRLRIFVNRNSRHPKLGQKARKTEQQLTDQ